VGASGLSCNSFLVSQQLSERPEFEFVFVVVNLVYTHI